MGRHRADAVHDPLAADPEGSARFHDFDEYEWLVGCGERDRDTAYLIVLLGGEAGLRCGEMMALEWSDVDLAQASALRPAIRLEGPRHGTKGGRLRYVPLTVRLATALREHRHLRGARVLCQTMGRRSRRRSCRTTCDGRRVGRSSRTAASTSATHVLFTPRDAGRAGASDSGTRRSSGSRHDAAVHAPESGGDRWRDSAARFAASMAKGDIVETASAAPRKRQYLKGESWLRGRDLNPRTTGDVRNLL